MEVVLLVPILLLISIASGDSSAGFCWRQWLLSARPLTDWLTGGGLAWHWHWRWRWSSVAFLPVAPSVSGTVGCRTVALLPLAPIPSSHHSGQRLAPHLATIRTISPYYRLPNISWFSPISQASLSYSLSSSLSLSLPNHLYRNLSPTILTPQPYSPSKMAWPFPRLW